MTYPDFKLGRVIRALTEAGGRNREWLGSSDLYLFTRLAGNTVPDEARKPFLEFQAEITRLQRKYDSPAMHIPAPLLTDDEVDNLMNLFVDVVASWPGSMDMYR